MLPLESPLYLSMLASEDRRQEVDEIVPGSIQRERLVGVEIPLTWNTLFVHLDVAISHRSFASLHSTML
jgi:hypothetical protein